MSHPETREELLDKLIGLPDGPIDDEELKWAVRHYISVHWDEFSGSRETAMTSLKFDRYEGLFFKPPSTITFTVERHGSAVMGSKYAELQEWSIDLARNASKQQIVGKRRIRPLDKSLDVQTLVDKVASAITTNDTTSTDIIWLNNNKVKVLTSALIPETNKETTANRRKRFRAALRDELAKSGWHETSPNYFSNNNP